MKSIWKPRHPLQIATFNSEGLCSKWPSSFTCSYLTTGTGVRPHTENYLQLCKIK